MRLQYLISFLAAGVSAVPDEPFPRCAECLPASIHDAPGVGFGLSFSSATAAAHLFNGDVVDIILVDASPHYVELMARLVDIDKPPTLSRLDKWRRSINKKLGWPATPDVGTLADMLVDLRNAATLALASPIDRVAVSHPPIIGLTEYDLSDALEYAGLRPWLASELPRPKRQWPPLPQAGMYPAKLTEGHAVFAAHKKGLCENYKDLFECWEEEEPMALETVLVAGFTKGDIRAEVLSLQAPFESFQDEEVIDKFWNLSGGLDVADEFGSREEYWDFVRYRLELLVSGLPKRLTMVMLTGENATHPGFLNTLLYVLRRRGYSLGNGEDQVLVVSGEGHVDPEYASARGAAQYARWRQEAPIGCMEVKDCEDERRRHTDDERVELR
ncbi:hypothetical protein G7Z17_g1598 [Cylindrodendrum hubeiense]|uniref:Uncharacterized protein n=1 Tax=Cylindrodendrum hubeiense TaxID=595255 RepID=A0A9P5HEE5_9HYPO|nr:hypothetical protein G7Z17_g1598 [Cylindrodendrum hubeiense]